MKVIINEQKSDTWKIPITITINFISSKDTNKEWTTHSKSDNIEVMTYDNPDETIEDHFEGHSFIDSPGCIGKKKTSLNPKNDDDKMWQQLH